MEKWKVTLTNGEVIDEHDMRSWRNLKAKCDSEGLKIKSLIFEGKEADPRAVAYFMIFDALTFILSKSQRFRRGIGSLRSNGKARIIWRTTDGNIEGGNYVEIIQPKNSVYQDLSILVERDNDQDNK